MIEKITRVPLRQIWKHEAKEFTTWLQNNTDVLIDVVGFTLVNVEREKSTGNFNVDLYAEDSSGNTVIIENQLEKSDHKHLGQLITYLTAFEAKKAIWIVSEPKQEHINAVSWLNESTNCEFYLLKVEVIKIGKSNPAPLLTLIVEPSEEIREVSSIKQEKTERHKLRYLFWKKLIEKSKNKHSLFNAISPSEYNWIGAGSGLRGVHYNYWITKDGLRISIYIDRGKDSEKENLKIFKTLYAKKRTIEKVFGDKLDWDEKENDRACTIRKEFHTAGWNSDESKWGKAQDEAIEAMVRLEKATKKIINDIKI